MSTYLERFKTRRKVNPELAQRYEFDASYYGDRNIKNELASARRTATSLAKASAAFSYLRPEQKLALDAATSAMRSLAKDLAELALWANDYRAFCVIEREREHVESLDKIAVKRWNGDINALNFEAEILTELETKEGQCALGDWFHGQGHHKEVAREDFSVRMDSTPSPKKNYSLSQNTAAVLEGLNHGSPNKFSSFTRDRWHYVCGWRDYEEYLTWRKSVAGLTASALASYRVLA